MRVRDRSTFPVRSSSSSSRGGVAHPITFSSICIGGARGRGERGKGKGEREKEGRATAIDNKN